MFKRNRGHLKKPGFGSLIRAPQKAEKAFEAVENIPIIGDVIVGIEDIVPGLRPARDALKAATDVENTLRKLTGVDVEGRADAADERFGGGRSQYDVIQDGSTTGRQDLERVPVAMNLTPPSFHGGQGFSQPHFSLNSQTSWASGAQNKTVATA